MELPKRESERVEFKESLSDFEKIIITAVAFANTKGGEIYIGIKDNGELVGVKIGKDTIEKIANRIISSIEPTLSVSIDLINIEGKNVIKIEVPEGENKPYSYKGTFYKRIGATNQRMSYKEVELLIKKKIERDFSWDEMPVDVGIEEIDKEYLKDFVRKIGKKFINVKHALKNLNYIRGEKLTRASILLFGKNPSLFFPQNAIKFMKVDEFGDIVAMKTFEGKLIEILENVLAYMKEHLPKKIVIEEFKRIEKYYVPLEVIREAVVNAIIHRDYSIRSFIYIKIEPEKIEIKNPGTLPQSLRIEDLYTTHSSILRNPLIAKAFDLAGYIEAWGSGTLKMINLMLREGLQPPKFEEEHGFFKVTLSFESLTLDPLEKRIFEYVKEKKVVRSSQVSEEFGIAQRTARKILRKLYTLKLIGREGKKKGVIYYSYV